MVALAEVLVVRLRQILGDQVILHLQAQVRVVMVELARRARVFVVLAVAAERLPLELLALQQLRVMAAQEQPPQLQEHL